MTILTKPFSEKKGDKAIAPLVLNEQATAANGPEDVEAQRRLPRIEKIVIFPGTGGNHRVTTATTLCLLMTALTVVGIGIVGGKILYDQYLRVSPSMGPKSYSFDSPSFEGWAQIPMNDAYDKLPTSDTDDNKLVDYLWDDDDIDFKKKVFPEDFFQQNFEINKDEKYEKIDVPDFRDGRSGRFIHDFNTNTTGIIDVTGNRCFVMPLNRENVLPPKSLFDLIHKMWEGYYKVNTDLVRRNMKVVLPPITDTRSIGGYIANECEGLPIYRLEKYVGGVVKRSAEAHADTKFASFAGSGISQIDIVNLDDVIAYEKNLNSH